MKKYFFFCITLTLLFSCNNEEEKSTDKAKNQSSENFKKSNKTFVSDTIVIRNYFDDKAFKHDTMLALLKELDICNPDTKAPFNLHKPPCEPKYYKFYRYNKKLAWHDAFALEIRAGVDNFPLRRLMIFKRMNGKLVKLNGFAGNLVEMHTTPSGYNNLMVLFRDTEAGSFVLKYCWDKKNQLYKYKSVEAIMGYLVKPELKDSISEVVIKRLEKNHMFF